MMGLGANFIMREVASSANSYANFHYDIYQDTFSTSDSLILLYHYKFWYFSVMGVKRGRGFPIMEGAWETPSPHPMIFFKAPSIKTDAPHGMYSPPPPPPLKNEAPHLKNKPPPLKIEVPFQEMIPRKNK